MMFKITIYAALLTGLSAKPVASAFRMPFTVMKMMIVEIGVTSRMIAATHTWYECKVELNHQISVFFQSSNTTCKVGEFKCDDGICIPFNWVCNGREDCPDRSDENPSQCNAVSNLKNSRMHHLILNF